MSRFYGFRAFAPIGLKRVLAERKRQVATDFEDDLPFADMLEGARDKYAGFEEGFGILEDILFQRRREWAGANLAVSGAPHHQPDEFTAYLTPAEVKRAARGLDKVTPELMQVWARERVSTWYSEIENPEERRAEHEGQCLRHLAALQRFYRRAASRGHGVFVTSG